METQVAKAQPVSGQRPAWPDLIERMVDPAQHCNSVEFRERDVDLLLTSELRNAATPASSPRTALRQIAVDNDARKGSVASARRALRMVDSVSLSASAKRPSRVAATDRTASLLRARPSSTSAPMTRRRGGIADGGYGSPASSDAKPRRQARTDPPRIGLCPRRLISERKEPICTAEIEECQAMQPAETWTENSSMARRFHGSAWAVRPAERGDRAAT